MTDTASFDLFEFIAGTEYPEETIRVYTNAKAVYELDKLETKIANTVDSDEANALDAEADALKDSIRDTSLIFTLRGLPSAVVEDVDKRVAAKFGSEGLSPERNEFRIVELLTLHIVGAAKADGTKDEREWDHETTERLLKALPPTQSAKLLDGVIELSIKAREFEDYTVTPDFS